MITGLGGTPGSGKSYVAVTWIHDALSSGKRIFTNMSSINAVALARDIVVSRWGRRVFIKKPEFAASKARDVLARFMVINPDEVIDLIAFRRRFAGNLVSHVRGSEIFLDEVMMHWFSRDYRSFTKELVFFFSQHRKYGINVTYIAQDLEKVDGVIRSMTERFCVVTNIKHKRIYNFLHIPLDIFVESWRNHDGSKMGTKVIFPRSRVYGLYDTVQLFSSPLADIADPLEPYYGDGDGVHKIPNPFRDTVYRRGRVVSAAKVAPPPAEPRGAHP